jgi:hypothetical protein
MQLRNSTGLSLYLKACEYLVDGCGMHCMHTPGHHSWPPLHARSSACMHSEEKKLQ